MILTLLRMVDVEFKLRRHWLAKRVNEKGEEKKERKKESVCSG